MMKKYTYSNPSILLHGQKFTCFSQEITLQVHIRLGYGYVIVS